MKYQTVDYKNMRSKYIKECEKYSKQNKKCNHFFNFWDFFVKYYTDIGSIPNLSKILNVKYDVFYQNTNFFLHYSLEKLFVNKLFFQKILELNEKNYLFQFKNEWNLEKVKKQFDLKFHEVFEKYIKYIKSFYEQN